MPKVFLKFFEEAVERTEEEIAELRAGGLLREDGASGTAPASSGAAGTPSGSSPAGNGKEKQS